MNWDQIELENLRREKEEREDRERREREQRDQERKEEMERRSRSADNWPEALRKQIHLFGREIAQEAAEERKYGPFPKTNPDIDDWFIDGKAACERALVIWSEVEIAKAEKRAELERQLAALDDELRLEVADLLEHESERSGWKHVVQAIREEDPENWLQW